MAASAGHFDRYKKVNSNTKDGTTGATPSKTNRKNENNLVFGNHTKYDPQSTVLNRPSMKNLQSTGDLDIDRKPRYKQFTKRSTSNLIVEDR